MDNISPKIINLNGLDYYRLRIHAPGSPTVLIDVTVHTDGRVVIAPLASDYKVVLEPS
jgi:hypothetical protein